MATYDHQKIEKKWQERWEKARVGEVKESPEDVGNALYHLIMLPYPSGAGLHVGHVESYTAVDILTRVARMRGKRVLFPIGYDAFGLPAENYAVKTGVHPSITTKKAIENFHRQMKAIGLSFDWSREISTADPEYYKWTQWLFLKLYENDLAYRAKAPVNWCGGCQTVLANEQVVQGACDRCKTPVVQKELEQWFFRITKYADRLLAGLEKIDWPEKIKAMQREWIGRSEGAEIDFHVISETSESNIPVFTTRADTLMGVSYIVLAPEHPLVDTLTTKDKQDAVVAYRDEARKKSDLERTQLEKDKSGVFIGSFASHPITREPIPIWISDYVVMGYGTGAVMGVPAHDERDFVFAKKYELPVRKVIVVSIGGMNVNANDRVSGVPEDIKVETECWTGDGTLVNSGIFDGLTSADAKQKIVEHLEGIKHGRKTVRYHLRDWLVSRQRFWGAPIPMVICEICGYQPLEQKDLPVCLPDDVDFSAIAQSFGGSPSDRTVVRVGASGGKPASRSPLLDSDEFHVGVTCPKCGGQARRESDTMDTFVDSSWYYLRYTDPFNKNAFADAGKISYWCPVDLYVGGAEHAVMHLLYSRFFAYALHDLGYLPFEEPFLKLRNQGIILGPDGDKMSKSKGNVVNPDEAVAEYGADTLRMYEMFMGPLEDAKPWNTNGLVGVRRFLDKVVKYVDVWLSRKEDQTFTPFPLMEKTVKKVTEDTDTLKFNTAVSAMMGLMNELLEPRIFEEKDIQIGGCLFIIPQAQLEKLLKLLAPYAPHLAEELWEKIGGSDSVFDQSWPEYDVDVIKDEIVEIAVQVNGKLRGTVKIAPNMNEADAARAAKEVENVARHLGNKNVVKTIYVPGRMINFVVQ